MVRPFARWPKGRFHNLTVRNPITITASASQKRVLSSSAPTTGFYPTWRQVSGPCALGIAALAIAVVLWGYGYKLSLYERNTSPSARTPVAKLWIEPRAASVATASSIKAISHSVAGAQAAVATVPRLPGPCRAFACILFLRKHHVVLFDLLVPARAPPPLRLRLA